MYQLPSLDTDEEKQTRKNRKCGFEKVKIARR